MLIGNWLWGEVKDSLDRILSRFPLEIMMNALTDLTAISKLNPISADSHIVEPPNCYVDYIDPKYRDTAPKIVYDDNKGGDLYCIDGMDEFVPLGLVASAGTDPATRNADRPTRFEELNRGSWNGKERIAEQERDGVAAEVIYPTVGMVLCNHPDIDYKHACFHAYNRWLQEFVAAAPRRLFGVGQTAARSPSDLIDDMQRIKEVGFVGVMLPGHPEVEDYDSPIYDPVWRTAIELNLPVSFHSLTSKADRVKQMISGLTRGPRINQFQAMIRSCQDIIGMFVYGGVFERHPNLKVISVEADAGWVPHYVYRMDHAFKVHGHWMGGVSLSRMPSEYFYDNIYLTFQDDKTAFQLAHLMNPKRLLWATDFPHGDSTWPHSQEVLWNNTRDLDYATIKSIIHDNTAELYNLDV